MSGGDGDQDESASHGRDGPAQRVPPIGVEGILQVSSVLHDKVPAWTGNRAHMVVVARGDLARARQEHDPITESWLDDADTVLGPDVRDLLLNGTG